ncbi:DUF5007 domain-containing protein [Sphingobacterium sp. E70]|uniref:DUF5007 domain-containing protein n=1 Tax=Sphingobacterium sp. E70 TaxID=2853439 RepID=UPI00359C3224
MGESGNSGFVKAQPDSGYVFDVELTNTGGRRYLRNFKLKPLRERPYEPSIIDPITGLSPLPYTFITKMSSNMRGTERIGQCSIQISEYISTNWRIMQQGRKPSRSVSWIH